jgi:hypothetical protein
MIGFEAIPRTRNAGPYCHALADRETPLMALALLTGFILIDRVTHGLGGAELALGADPDTERVGDQEGIVSAL